MASVLGFVASVVASTAQAVNGSTALALAVSGIASIASGIACRTAIDADSTDWYCGTNETKGHQRFETVFVVDRDGKIRCTTYVRPVHHSPAAVVDSDADEEQSVLDGTAEVGDDSAADASPGIVLNGSADAEPAATLDDGTAFVENRLAEGASYGATTAKVCIFVAGGAVVGSVVLPALGLGALSLAGFTSAGPAAGSIAASWMSSIAISNGGGVAAGSLYAVLQSTAMGGGWLLGTPVTSAVGAAGGGLAYWLCSKLSRTTTSSSRGCDPGSGCDVVIFDGTAFVKDSDAHGASDIKGASTDSKGASTDGASYGATTTTICLIMARGAVVGCVTLPALGLGALSYAGFTSAGPAAGSFAASCMSSIAVSNGGGVAAGSLYSVLQSTAMMGGGWLLGTPVTSTVGAATSGGIASWVSSKLHSHNNV